VAKVQELAVPLVSLQHLLAMKMVSGEPKDGADVRRILRLEQLDYAGRDDRLFYRGEPPSLDSGSSSPRRWWSSGAERR
jgi:hypothetical protein